MRIRLTNGVWPKHYHSTRNIFGWLHHFRYLILLNVVAFGYPLVSGANNIDSLLTVAKKTNKAYDWNQVATFYEESMDTALLRVYSQKAYGQALLENNPDEKGKALLVIGAYHEYMGDIPTALEKAMLAMQCFRTPGHRDMMAKANGYIAFYHFEQGHYHEAIGAYRQAILLLQQSNNPDKESNIARSYGNISNSFLYLGNTDSVIYYNQKGLEAGYKAKDTVVIIFVSNQLGVMNARKSRFKEAMEHYEEALRLNQLSKNKRDIPVAFMNIATLYSDWGNESFAIEFVRNAEQSVLLVEDRNVCARIFSKAGSIYYRFGHYRKAIEAAGKSFVLSNDQPIYQYNNMEVLASSYHQLNKLDSCEIYLNMMKTYLQADHSISTSRYYAIKGQVLLDQGKYNEAIPFLEKAIELKKSTEKQIEKEPEKLYKRLADAYILGPHDYRKALHYSQLYINLTDSIHQKKYADAMADFNVRYNTAEKELEITRLNLQQEHMKAEKARVVIWLVVIVALFLGALLYSMILRQKKRTEKILLNQKLEEKEREFDALTSDMEMRQIKSYLEGLEAERTRLAGELHDNVSNALLGVEFKIRTPGVLPEEISGILQGIHEHVRNISHELMPPVFQYATLAEIIDDYVYMQNGMNGPRFERHMEPEDGWENLPQETALELHRIVQEACGNALKHSGASLVSITLQRDDGHVTLVVKDDGRGMDINSKKTGLGLQIIRDRAAKMNGSAEVVSVPGKGTTITVKV